MLGDGGVTNGDGDGKRQREWEMRRSGRRCGTLREIGASPWKSFDSAFVSRLGHAADGFLPWNGSVHMELYIKSRKHGYYSGRLYL